MLNVEVQPHSDGIGGDEVIHLAVLIHLNLRVARAWAERAHHNGRPALLSADQLGDGIDVVDREPHDRRPRGHTADFFRADISQIGKAIAAQEGHARHKVRNGPPHRGRAKKQRLVQTPRTQQTVGEHMPALRIGTKLNFVDGEEIGAQPFGHRLDRADPVLGALRHDPLFPGDQRHHRRPAHRNDTVIDLARQKPKRQADHPGAVRQHPFDCVVSFSGVCRPQNGRHTPALIHLDGLCTG